MASEVNQATERLRPLKRIRQGVYRSKCGKWTFKRHYGDPRPQRWMAYIGNAVDPANEGDAVTSLWEVVAWAEKRKALQ
jgi:hypothetical protein